MSKLLKDFAKHTNWELVYDKEHDGWAVYEVTGSRNDRIWTLASCKPTPREAIREALKRSKDGSITKQRKS